METTLQFGEKAPDFLLRDLNGHPHALSHYHGKVVVINFWSAECPWSSRSDEAIVDLRAEWEGRVDWLFIAPNANETLAEMRQEAEKRNLPLVLHDPERQVADLYGAENTPHIFVIDAEGILRYQGAFDDVTFRQKTPTVNYLKNAVEAVLEEKTPDPTAVQPYGCMIVYYPEG